MFSDWELSFGRRSIELRNRGLLVDYIIGFAIGGPWSKTHDYYSDDPTIRLGCRNDYWRQQDQPCACVSVVFDVGEGHSAKNGRRE